MKELVATIHIFLNVFLIVLYRNICTVFLRNNIIDNVLYNSSNSLPPSLSLSLSLFFSLSSRNYVHSII